MDIVVTYRFDGAEYQRSFTGISEHYCCSDYFYVVADGERVFRLPKGSLVSVVEPAPVAVAQPKAQPAQEVQHDPPPAKKRKPKARA